jgi:hypothetical protein
MFWKRCPQLGNAYRDTSILANYNQGVKMMARDGAIKIQIADLRTSATVVVVRQSAPSLELDIPVGKLRIAIAEAGVPVTAARSAPTLRLNATVVLRHTVPTDTIRVGLVAP